MRRRSKSVGEGDQRVELFGSGGMRLATSVKRSIRPAPQVLRGQHPRLGQRSLNRGRTGRDLETSGLVELLA
jgi:hypothetical protein